MSLSRARCRRFISGGRIDHAHHYNNAYRALDETLALEAAVQAVMKEVDLTETLLVVTADHSHVLTLGGLATHRGNPIFGESLYNIVLTPHIRRRRDYSSEITAAFPLVRLECTNE